jgi:hypothetical protein
VTIFQGGCAGNPDCAITFLVSASYWALFFATMYMFWRSVLCSERQWTVGAAVVIKDSLAREHNGKKGRLLRYLESEGRWAVQLEKEAEPYSIRRENLAPVETLFMERLFYSFLLMFSLVRAMMFLSFPLGPIKWAHFWIMDAFAFLLGVFTKSIVVLVWIQVTVMMHLQGRPFLPLVLTGGKVAFVVVHLCCVGGLAYVMTICKRCYNPDPAQLLYMDCVTGLLTLFMSISGFAARWSVAGLPRMHNPVLANVMKCMLVYFASFLLRFVFTALFLPRHWDENDQPKGVLPFDACVGFKIISAELVILDVLPSLCVLRIFYEAHREAEGLRPENEEKLLSTNLPA